MIKIAKFGGSSVADAEHFKKIKAIVDADPARRFVVVSACGRRFKGDTKVTDLLYLVNAHVKYHVSCEELLEDIGQRYFDIADELELTYPIREEFAAFAERARSGGYSTEELVSRGEYFTARLMAEYLGLPFLDAATVVAFHHDGTLSMNRTSELVQEYGQQGGFVMPGFYGATREGQIKLLDRGGGDISGSILAKCLGADLYESYCGSILATAALGAAAFSSAGSEALQIKAVMAPMLIAAVGILLSILGIFLVRTKEGATMRELLRSLGVGVNFSSLLIAAATFGILCLLGVENWVGLSFSVITGLVAGIVIGQATEYFTSHSYKPTQKIAGSAQTGPATVIIAGIGSGMISTAIPVVTIGVAIILAYLCAIGFDIENMMAPQNMSMGLYGIGIAAVGMLSTLGITLATDAYGPIADNAGGNAEMSGLGPEVRKRTDALDALGNTTAATGKGFAIGSAALTALALLASYIEEIRIGLIHNGVTMLEMSDGTMRFVQDASILDFMEYYRVSLMNPTVLIGVFIGAMMSFLFCGLTMNAVGRAAQSMVEEVRRQFREIKGILTGEGTPDYARCVAISTRGAQREMLFPSLLAIAAPVVVGLVFGVAGVMGLLVGGLSSGFVLAVFMANAGGAWDNAKKMVEEGHFGGKGSDCHRATVVGDTVGDPFKDTSGPSLNILIKLMSMVAIVMAGLTVAFHLF